MGWLPLLSALCPALCISFFQSVTSNMQMLSVVPNLCAVRDMCTGCMMYRTVLLSAWGDQLIRRPYRILKR